MTDQTDHIDSPDDDADDSAWTPESAAQLAEVTARTQEALGAHSRAMLDSNGDQELVFRASEDLLTALVAYADAQAAYTGYGFPLGVLEQFLEDDEEDEDGDELPTTGLSVLQRRDYVVTDAEAVLSAGRAAYLRVHPDDSAAEAASDVDHLGRALYQLAHADGWDGLYDVDGLTPVAGVVAVVDQEELLGPDPDTWTGHVIDEDDTVLYSQADVFRG